VALGVAHLVEQHLSPEVQVEAEQLLVVSAVAAQVNGVLGREAVAEVDIPVEVVGIGMEAEAVAALTTMGQTRRIQQHQILQ
jgi:hypothetical protein